MTTAGIALAQQLEQIAAVVRMVASDDGYLRVSFGTEVSADFLKRLGSLPGATRHATAWDAPSPYVIEWVRVEVDGVAFEAQRTRDATAEECARLEQAEPEIEQRRRRVDTNTSAVGGAQ